MAARQRERRRRRCSRGSNGRFPARLTLPPGSRRLQVHYTALDFTAPEKLRFQTRLEPGDTDWQDVGDRRVAYYYDFHSGELRFPRPRREP